MRAYFELFDIYFSLLALTDNPLVRFGSCDERSVIGLGVREQDKDGFIRRLLNFFFLVDFQAVRPASEIHHPYREQIGMVRYIQIRFEYFYALDPEFILDHIVERDIGEFVFEE